MSGDSVVERSRRFHRGRLRIRQLRLLIALDDHRSMHGAAAALGTGQPSISRQLGQLEASLGVTLFDRSVAGLMPTAFGAALLRRVRPALARLLHGQDMLAKLKRGAIGRVDVGVVLSPALNLLPQAVAEFKLNAPLVKIGIQSASSDVLFDSLKRGRLDFYIGRLPEARDGTGIAFERVGIEPVCVVARPGHALSQAAHLDLAQLAGLPWILPAAGSVLRGRVEAMFRSADMPLPRNVVDTSSLLLVAALLRYTDALHVLPTEVARHYQSMGAMRILPITLPCTTDAFGIVYDTQRQLMPAAASLLAGVRKAAAAYSASTAVHAGALSGGLAPLDNNHQGEHE